MRPRSPSSLRLLITAGPTHEPIDAVRYIGNRSSGRMGLALATAAIERGLTTTLLLGPVDERTVRADLPQDSHLRLLRFQTTADLERLLHEEWPGHDVLIMAAAVADFRPKQTGTAGAATRDEKLRRSDGLLTLDLEPTPDLLAGISAMTRDDQFVVGFALEPRSRLLESARDKLERKRLDAIVANPLETMTSERIEAVVLTRDGRDLAMSEGAPVTKRQFASRFLELLSELIGAGRLKAGHVAKRC